MKLSDTDLVGIIRAHRRDSLGVEDGDLSNERAKAMDHYHGRPYGTEVTGRSSVVSRDLQEAVDWAMPAIMRVFVQSGNIAEFDPVGPEDEQQAQQESDYVNQVLMRDNPGFMILHDAVKDTLLLKNGYVKHFWEEEEKVSEEEYSGLSMDQVQQLLSGYEDEPEIIGQDSKVVVLETPMGPQEVELFDIRIKCKKKVGKLATMAVPTEEVRVSRKCRGSLQDSPFTEHVTKKTRSELIEMGMPRDFVDQLPARNEAETDSQDRSRDTVTDESDDTGATFNDRSMDEIEYCEAYIRIDYDDDGIAELRRIVTVAETRIPPGAQWNEPIEAVPMTGFVMKRVPHRHVGESLDDEIADLQEIKTVLERQLLDNLYLTNNARFVMNEKVNIKDALSSVPGAHIRVRGDQPVGGDLVPLVTPPVIDKILPAINYWDQVKHIRSGVRPGSDLDPETLQQVTKGAYLENLNRLSQKIEMITRLLAETGVKEWVLQSHALLVRHQDKARMVQLRGKWVEVNPSEWKNRTDLTVRVGLGTGNEEEKRQKLLLLAQLQDRAGPHGMVGPNQLYQLSADVAKALGFDIPEKYFLAPDTPEWQKLQQERNSKPDPEMAKVQGQQQLEQMRMQMQQQTDRNRQEMEAQQQQAKLSMEMELAKYKADMQMQFERERAQMHAQIQIEIAKINAAAKIDTAQLTEQTTLSAQQESATDAAVSDNGGMA